MKSKKGWVIRRILKYGSPLLSIGEMVGIRNNGLGVPHQPCVFIIGAPRTGSTILYQLVTSMLDVSYIDNLANMARYNPYVGLRLSNWQFKDQTHHSFSSKFGNTIGDGLHAPAEALFFYRWFPKDRHYTVPGDLTPAQISAFRETINALINRYNKPLVLKNLSFSLRLKVLKEALPDAKFIVVKRNPLYTAQSIILAMRNNKVPDHKLWSILPREAGQLEALERFEMVVKQIFYIEKQIYEDLKQFPEDHILYIDYEKLGPGTEMLMEEIISFLGPDVKKRDNIPEPEIKVKNRINLRDNEIDMLKQQIGKMDWENFNA
ncbi:MAG TPA: sulfotransferase [Bacteroidales bacterium]|nr:sulfotransferase [Bacteroidales bacterium]